MHILSLDALTFGVLVLLFIAGFESVVARDTHRPYLSMRLPVILSTMTGWLIWVILGYTLVLICALSFVAGVAAGMYRDKVPSHQPKSSFAKEDYAPEDDPNWTNYKP